MDTDGHFPTPTTRRTIVATGAKLAYAAPLVATSLKLSTLNVAATHSGPRGSAEIDLVEKLNAASRRTASKSAP